MKQCNSHNPALPKDQKENSVNMVANEIALKDILKNNCPHKRQGFFQHYDILFNQIEAKISGLTINQATSLDKATNTPDICRPNIYDCKKTTVYDTMNNPCIQYRNILSDVAIAATKLIFKPQDTLSFVVDDTLYERAKGFCCELSSSIFNHTSRETTNGYFCLSVGLTNGKILLPVGMMLIVTSDDEKFYDEAYTTPCKKDTIKGSEEEYVRKHLLLQKMKLPLKLSKVSTQR